MSHPDPLRDYEDDQQQQDEMQSYMRCVELVQKAQRHGELARAMHMVEAFTKQDIEDLIYHLGIKEYFRG